MEPVLAIGGRPTRIAPPRERMCLHQARWRLARASGLVLTLIFGGERMPARGAEPLLKQSNRVLPPAPSPSSKLRTSPPPGTVPPPAPKAAPAPVEETRRIRVRTETGEMTIARMHGSSGAKTSVYLPDGQLRFISGNPAFTEEPFQPKTIEALRTELGAGPFAKFQSLQTPHYLIFYQSTRKFAESSGKLLEDLYKGLCEALRKRDVPIHEAEFPLVAIIFRTEHDFRAHQPVDPDVQAYYEILTNRILFYQESERDQYAPEVTALRRPQTVAHEGTHQILSNIGVQPRLGSWPLWLIEGLAEYCSPPVTTKTGAVTWKGLGAVNPMHMATIRDLEDPASMLVPGASGPKIGRDPKTPLVAYLVTRSELSPTDYALSWAMTHYLAMKRGDDFVAFLKRMSQLPPLEPRTPEQHLADFRATFGDDLVKLDKTIGAYLAKLKGFKDLPYYAVMFEQPIGAGRTRRAAMVSQSPLMIRQWIDTVSTAGGGDPHWEALPHPSRARAILTVEEWMRSR